MAIGPGFKRAGMPHEKEMEIAALGCMLTGYPEAVSCVCEMLDLSCFYDPQHQAIFKAGASLYQRGAAVDILTVRDELEQIGQLEKLEDPDYLNYLIERTISTANIEQYCKILRDSAGSRKALTLFQDAINSILENPQRPDVDEIRQKFEDIAGGLAPIGDIIQAYKFSEYEQSMQTEPDAIKTGYNELDRIAPVTPGAITIIAGRPSHGKTTFLLNLMMQQAAAYPDKHFFFFSYEQTRNQLMTRLLMREANLVLDPYGNNYTQYKRYIKYKNQDEPAIEAARRRLADFDNRIFLIDERYTVEQLTGVLAQLAKRHRIGAVYIDYIQKIGTKFKSYSRQTELQTISNQLLDRALSLKIPVIMGAQFNREGVKTGRQPSKTGEPGANKKRKPITEDYIREAGDIEQDANLILGLWDDRKEGGKEDGLAVYVLKNRDGEPRHEPITLNYSREVYRISDAKESPEHSAGGNPETAGGEVYSWEKD